MTRADRIEAAAREMMKAMMDTDHQVGVVVGSAILKLRDALRLPADGVAGEG